MAFSEACELLCSTENPDNKRIKRLIDNGRLYNAADGLKNTLLHHAATSGNYEIVKYLVDSGSEINVRNNFGSTPLMSNLKTEFPCKQIIEILLKAHANIHFEDNGGKSALSILESRISSSENTEWIEIYKMFLENATYFEHFNLLQFGNEKIIDKLLQTNLDILLTDNSGVSLVHAIARNRNFGIMAMLHRKSNFDINLRTTYCRWTPLMCAALYGSISATKFLINEGADVNAADNKGRTALYNAYAVINFSKTNKDCFQVLLERGANAQIEVTYTLYDSRYTILNVILRRSEDFGAGDLLLANLALQEAKGTEISQLIRSTIESHSRLKTYFQECKQQLTMTIYRSITLFDVLTASETKLERYLRDKELTSKLSDFQAVEYFHTLKRKILLKAKFMIELRKSAALIISKLLIEIDHEMFPSILDEIISYLGEKDIKYLISIKNKLFN